MPTIPRYYLTHLVPLLGLYVGEIVGFAVRYATLPPPSFSQLSSQLDPDYLKVLKNAQDGLTLALTTQWKDRFDRVGSAYHFTTTEISLSLSPVDSVVSDFPIRIVVGDGVEHGVMVQLHLKPGLEHNSVALVRECDECAQALIVAPGVRMSADSLQHTVYEGLRVDETVIDNLDTLA